MEAINGGEYFKHSISNPHWLDGDCFFASSGMKWVQEESINGECCIRKFMPTLIDGDAGSGRKTRFHICSYGRTKGAWVVVTFRMLGRSYASNQSIHHVVTNKLTWITMWRSKQQLLRSFVRFIRNEPTRRPNNVFAWLHLKSILLFCVLYQKEEGVPKVSWDWRLAHK